MLSLVCAAADDGSMNVSVGSSICFLVTAPGMSAVPKSCGQTSVLLTTKFVYAGNFSDPCVTSCRTLPPAPVINEPEVNTSSGCTKAGCTNPCMSP